MWKTSNNKKQHGQKRRRKGKQHRTNINITSPICDSYKYYIFLSYMAQFIFVLHSVFPLFYLFRKKNNEISSLFSYMPHTHTYSIQSDVQLLISNDYNILLHCCAYFDEKFYFNSRRATELAVQMHSARMVFSYCTHVLLFNINNFHVLCSQ